MEVKDTSKGTNLGCENLKVRRIIVVFKPAWKKELITAHAPRARLLTTAQFSYNHISDDHTSMVYKIEVWQSLID